MTERRTNTPDLLGKQSENPRTQASEVKQPGQAENKGSQEPQASRDGGSAKQIDDSRDHEKKPLTDRLSPDDTPLYRIPLRQNDSGSSSPDLGPLSREMLRGVLARGRDEAQELSDQLALGVQEDAEESGNR